MTVGFEVFNNDGYKIAGSDLANLCFYGKGRINVPAGGAAVPMAPGGIFNFYKSSAPMVVRGGAIQLVSMNAPNGSLADYSVAGWVEYWSFGPVSPSSDGATLGFEIYNDNGMMTFSTARPFLKLIGNIDVHKDNYSWYSKRLITYLPFSQQIPEKGDFAFAIGNTRVYWTSTQFINPQKGYLFTDTWRGVRGMHIDANGNFSSSVLLTAMRRFDGSQGNFNYSPNGSAPITMLIADVSGL
jgi:hypothetical protein